MASFDKLQLGQNRPGDTNNHVLCNPSTGEICIVETLVVTNNTGGAVTYRVFHDDDGTTYDQSTALYYDVSISANTTDLLEFQNGLALANPNGNLAVRSSSASALTFTAYGSRKT